MSALRAALVPAFVLHRYPYRDSSLLMEAFTAEYGRVGLVARGARRPSSRTRGLLQPLRPLLLSWFGRGELMTLTQAEGAGPPLALAGERVMSAFYVNELVLRLLARHDPHAALFAAYVRTLEQLQAAPLTAAVLRVFEKRILEALGYGVDFAREAGGATPVSAAGRYRVEPQAGPVAASHGVPGRCLLQLAAERLESDSLPHARRVLAALLAPHLGPRPLNTPALLRSLRGLERRQGENDADTSRTTGR